MHKWDAGRALELIERQRVTNFSGVPTMSRELLAASRLVAGATRRRCKGMGGGGAPLQPDLVDKIDKSLDVGPPRPPATGSPRRPGSSPPTPPTCTSPSRRRAAESCPTLDAKLVDELGDDLAPGPTWSASCVCAGRW